MSKRRPATAADIVFGATIHYKHGDDGPFTRTVEEVLRPSDPYKAFSADDGCRYGLDDAYVDVMTAKLDIEGIRVKHLKFQRLTDDEITDLLIENNALREGLRKLLNWSWIDCGAPHGLRKRLDETLNKGVSDESKN